jgi:spore germination protein GerM
MTPPTDRDGMTEDLLETRLRRALNTEAGMVNPSGDGLGRIRAGIAEEQSSIWWRRPALALVAAAFLGLAVGGVAVALSQNDDKTNLPAGPTTEPQTGAPTVQTTEAPTPTTTSSETGGSTGVSTVSVPVYFVADDGRELRLYREFHRTALQPEGKIATAVDQMFRPANDPDYSSSWPETAKVLSVSKSGDTATVNLSAFPSTGADAETKAVQQLVYTVTATDNSVKKVRLLVNGKAPQSGHSDWSQPVARASMLDVQGLIWILTPTEGSTVGSPVKVTVYGTAYEGNVIIKVFRGPSFDEEVASTFVTTEMGAFREASTTIPLDAGTYGISVYDENAENGDLIERDSKTFTVK